jgi:glycopeptide antibiotics resistance protein
LEILQSQIPERNFDFVDMFANIGGAIIGIIFLKIFSKIKEVS